MAAQAIASEYGCDLSEGQCPALPGEPCLCERFAIAALEAAETCAVVETEKLKAALSQIKELETLDDNKLSTSGEIACEALLRQQ